MDKTDGKMKRENYWGIYDFQCSCGAGMATNGERLSKAIAENLYYRCPNHLYGKCNKSYSAQEFKRTAHFIPSQIPAGLQ